MIIKTIYTCEKCGKEFTDDYDGCQIHESSAHARPSYKRPEAICYDDESSVYPSIIEVTMDNGAIAHYSFKNLAWGPTKAEDPLPQTEGLQEEKD